MSNSKTILLSIKHDDEFCDTAEVWMKADVDQREQNFILDTGCAVTKLSYNEFSAKYEAIEGGEYSSAFGKSKHEKIRVQSISAGPISRGPIEISRTPKGGNDKNLFGMDLLRDRTIELALPQSTLNFIDQPTHQLCSNKLWLDSGSIPFIEVTSRATTAKAVWDTGAGITIVDKAFFN